MALPFSLRQLKAAISAPHNTSPLCWTIPGHSASPHGASAPAQTAWGPLENLFLFVNAFHVLRSPKLNPVGQVEPYS